MAVVFTDVIQIYQSMSALARDLGAVNLAQGVPEPVHDARWRTALAAALPVAHFQYTPARGSAELRALVAESYGAQADRVVVTSGCTESLAAALAGLADLGQHTAVWLEPFYSYYPGLARLAGLGQRSVPIDLSGVVPRLDLARLRAVLRPLGGGAVLLLNSPHNPSGLVLDPADWAGVLEVMAETGCFLLLDDAYRDFRYGMPPVPYRELLATGRAALAGSVSKSLAASGIRLGWLVAPKALDEIAESAHMHLSNCAPDVLQRAALDVAAQVGPDIASQVTAHYQRKRDMLLVGLAAAGLRVLVPGGGHFVMALPTDDGRCANDHALAFAAAARVVPLPLESFFASPAPPWLRFSFAVPMSTLVVACHRMAGLRECA